MSIKVLKNQIEKFLSTDTPEVMAIKGAWGVGKTYSWNKFLVEAQNKIRLDKYSYVSLFGINSLDTLKFNIFQQIINKKLIGSEPNLKSFKSNADSLFESFGRKSTQFFSGIPWLKNFSSNIVSLSFLSIQKTIICLDDFERKGDKLSLKDVMGLISVLKEQKKCKIIIILNDELLENSAKEEYKKYREKVIDFEIEFNPDANDCSEIALGNDKIGKMLKEFSTKLGMSNIRILKKIERLSSEIVPIISELDHKVIHQALHSLCLFSWCFYSSEGTPDYEFVKQTNYSFLVSLGEDRQTDEEKLWSTQIRAYGYTNTDEFDLEIAKIVEKGFIEDESLLRVASLVDQKIKASSSEQAFHDAWDLYHDNFDNNQEEVIATLLNSFRQNVRYINPMNLDGTVRLFRELGEEDLAEEIIALYCKENETDESKFDLKYPSFAHNVKDKNVIENLKKISETFVVERTIKDVLEKISGKDSWGGDDERILAKATPDEYYDFFKSEKGPHLSSYVNTCLRFGQINGPDDAYSKIYENTIIALKRIASESMINKIRVQKYGIEIE